MSNQAYHAIRAAKHYKSWGRLNAVRYCEKRGVPRRLLTLALQLAGAACPAGSAS